MLRLSLPVLAILLPTCAIPIGSTLGTEMQNAAPEWLPFEHGVRAILVDRNGHFWFGTQEEGVARFDGQRFTRFTVEDGLASNQIRRLYEAQDGTIWIETGTVVSSFDGTELHTHTDKDYGAKQDWRARPHDLWFKGDQSVGISQLEGQPGVYRFDGRNLTWLTFPISGFTWKWTPEDLDGGNYFSVTTPAIRGKDGKLWFGTYGAVIGYDGRSFDILDNERLGFDEETGFLHVRSLFVDSKGNLWIGNNGIGVLLHDGKTTINFSDLHGPRKEKASGSIPLLKSVFSISEDRDGNMWFGTSKHGAWRYDGESWDNFSHEQGLRSRNIWSFYIDKRGDLWIAGSEPGGIARFDGVSFDMIDGATDRPLSGSEGIPIPTGPAER